MDDERLSAAFDRMAPSLPATRGWDDVLARARRRHRRRRWRTVGVAIAAGAAVVVGSLAANDRIGLPVLHSREPHLTARGQLLRADGTPVGTVELELQHAMVMFGRRVVAQPFGPGTRRWDIETHWFLKLPDVRSTLSATIRGAPGSESHLRATLCTACGPNPSGSLDLTPPEISELLNREASIVISADGSRIASGSVTLDRSSLRRGLVCWGGGSPPWSHCRHFYSGRAPAARFTARSRGDA